MSESNIQYRLVNNTPVPSHPSVCRPWGHASHLSWSSRTIHFRWIVSFSLQPQHPYRVGICRNKRFVQGDARDGNPHAIIWWPKPRHGHVEFVHPSSVTNPLPWIVTNALTLVCLLQSPSRFSSPHFFFQQRSKPADLFWRIVSCRSDKSSLCRQQCVSRRAAWNRLMKMHTEKTY